jgi:hypothetical protein
VAKVVGVLRWAEERKVAMVQERQSLDSLLDTPLASCEVRHFLDDLCLLREWCLPDRPINNDDY